MRQYFSTHVYNMAKLANIAMFYSRVDLVDI